MANIESKNLLVAVKAYSRGNALPLDASEVYDSLAAAQAYAKEANAYAGQTIKVLEDGEYKSYVLQPSENGLVLKQVGAVQPEDLKNYVQVVESLPTTGEENVIYLVGTEVKDESDTVIDTKWAGSIWVADGESGKYEEIFKDSKDIEKSIEDAIKALDSKFEAIGNSISANTDAIGKNAKDIKGINEAINDINAGLDTKASIENPVFIGSVKVKADATVADADAEEVAVKSYVDGLIAGIHSNTPKIVNSTNPLPTSKYKAGNVWRVSEAGTYAGQECEIGDVIICLNDYKAGEASPADFLVVQANIDGAVTSTVDAVVDTEIVVFDGVTGKVVKSSNITLSSLQTVISDSHTHANKATLDTYDKTQTELLAAAASDAQNQIATFETDKIKPVFDILPISDDGKSLNVYTKDEADELLNNKADSDSVYTKEEVNDAIDDVTKILPITGDGDNKSLDVYTKGEIDAVIGTDGSLTKNVNSKTTMTEVKAYIGDITTDTVKEYIDSNVGKLENGGTIIDYIDDKIGDIKDAEGNAQSVKDYVDTGLAGKADKATTIAGYGITDAYTKEEVNSKVSSDISTAKSELQGAIDGKVPQGDFDTLEGKVTTLIGDDANKSVKTIVTTELAKIINDNDATSVDTLEEIAAWIAAHPDSVAAINASITAIQNQLIGIAAGEGTVKQYIDNAVATKDLTGYATISYVNEQDAATLASAKAYTDEAIAGALTIVRF